MEIFRKFIDFFRLSDEDKEIIQSVIVSENLRRVIYVSVIAVPLSVIFYLIFHHEAQTSTGMEHEWRSAISNLHTLLFISFTIIGSLVYIFSYRIFGNTLIRRICIDIAISMILLIGALLAAADQMVTSAITPFLLSCLITGLIIIIPPRKALIYFAFGYLVFYFAISVYQENVDVLVSNQINGLAIAGIGLGLSFILWYNNLVKIKQGRIIEKQTRELIERNAEKDRFFSIIGHDLKSPLSGIMTLSEIMDEDLRENRLEGIAESISLLRTSSENTYKLLENLLEWSMSQTGKVRFALETFNLSSLIREKILKFSIQTKSKNISLRFDNTADIYIYADRNMMMTVLRNLISNAIKFTPTGGVIDIIVSKVAGETKISVKDDGIGMSEKIKDGLFRITENVSRLGTSEEKGTGLGLILCREFVEKHGGKIWAESEQGKGSVFSFTIPDKPGEGEKAPVCRENEKADENMAPDRLKILIVENDPLSRNILEKVVKRFSRDILFAVNGIVAVEAARSNPDIDLILMDISMPEMDGYEATRLIRQFNKDVIIIAQTAAAYSQDKDTALESGCNDYLSKPIHKDNMVQLLNKYFKLN